MDDALVLNIEAIDLPNQSFTAVICNHVLEHVDDEKALSEIHRIVQPGGRAYLTTPVIEGWRQTYENPGIDGKPQRTLHFGQHDHVRMYGADLRQRILAAGFDLREFTAEEPDVHRHGLWRGEKIFIATKPGAGSYCQIWCLRDLSCGGGFGLGLLDAVFEIDALDDVGEMIEAAKFAPVLFGALPQFEDHVEHAVAGQTAL